MNYDKYQKASAEPVASSMIETFRAIGYSLESAVADIIDNSISANAKNIWINRYWRGGESVITIKDDGCGMSDTEIINAMRPGSQNPLESRSENDLGRFGLGLKTASFSQCRKLTVLSKKTGHDASFWSWDLDYVADTSKWELIKWMPESFSNALDDVQSGTIIIWSSPDRIVSQATSENDERAKMKFSKSMDRVREHLALTFHRFIEDNVFNLYWANHKVEAWNPFCANEDKTQTQPSESLYGGATVQGFVLPHQKNFSSEDAYRNAAGMNGWASHQGFYVYRGKRLLIGGDWLGLFRKEEPYKLVRIKIDLPNTLDAEWQIDIKKSRAFPPAGCREQLEAYAKVSRNIGAEVFRHRGKILKQRAGSSFQPLWLENKKDSKWSFVINRDNEIVRTVRNMAKEDPEQAIETLLRYIEEAVPAPAIFMKEVGEEQPKQPFEGIDTKMIGDVMKQIFNNKLAEGMSREQARNHLKGIEPFNNFESLIETL